MTAMLLPLAAQARANADPLPAQPTQATVEATGLENGSVGEGIPFRQMTNEEMASTKGKGNLPWALSIAKRVFGVRSYQSVAAAAIGWEIGRAIARSQTGVDVGSFWANRASLRW